MKDDTAVRISEFLDGELSHSELDQLLKESHQPDVQQALKSYARIGHALRGDADCYSRIDVSQAVAQAIAGLEMDPAEQATSRLKQTGWLHASWFKPALGAAFASVVAVVTVVVNQGAIDGTNNLQVPTVAQQSPVNSQQIAAKTYDLAEFARSSGQTQLNAQAESDAREELNHYLVNHARSASGNNYQGMVPYVRAVAYEPGQKK